MTVGSLNTGTQINITPRNDIPVSELSSSIVDHVSASYLLEADIFVGCNVHNTVISSYVNLC